MLLAVCLLCGSAPSSLSAETPDYPRVLKFARDGEAVASLDLGTLRNECGGSRVEIEDPYYSKRMAFYACPLGWVLARGFGVSAESLAEQSFFLRARDGYTRQESGARLLEAGPFLAFADAELSGPEDAAFGRGPRAQGFAPVFAPIDRRQVDPGPFYLIWTGAHQGDPHQYPWPYQLQTIEIGSFAQAFPHMVPAGAPNDSAAARGFDTFRRECMACHSINGQGGKVGPDLNVPMSIVEYRPTDQIKQYIRNPMQFRYTSMPAHRHFTEAQLDELVAYFEWMQTRKHDPGEP